MTAQPALVLPPHAVSVHRQCDLLMSPPWSSHVDARPEQSPASEATAGGDAVSAAAVGGDGGNATEPLITRGEELGEAEECSSEYYVACDPC